MSDQVRVTSGGATRSALLVTSPTDVSGNPQGTTANPTTTQAAALSAGTDRSGTITTGGTAQQLAAANLARKGLVGQNISAGDLWLNEIGGAASVDTVGSYKIPAGSPFSVSTNRAISIIGATTGQKFTATEY